MSKYTPQDIINEESVPIFKASLDKNFFLIQHFADETGEKDKYPDIDGQIRLRDGNRNYLNKYLHYQLKGQKGLKDKKFSCSKDIVKYLASTNVPTLIFVVDTESKQTFWYFLKQEDIKDQKKGLTIDLSPNEIKGNSLELNHLWTNIAKPDNYDEASNALEKISSAFSKNLYKAVGLIYLFKKIHKDEVVKTFNQTLEIDTKQVEVIIKNLEEQKVIISTSHWYLVENDQLGVESLHKLLKDLDLSNLDKQFKDKNQKKAVLNQLARIDDQKSEKYLTSLAKDIKAEIKSARSNEKVIDCLDLLEQFLYRVPKEALQIYNVIKSKKPLKTTVKYHKGFGRLEGKNNEQALIKAIEVITHLRYFYSKKVFNDLVYFANHAGNSVRSKALEGIKSLCEYNLEALQKIGYNPQLEVIAELEKWSKSQQLKNIDVLEVVAKEILELSFEGRNWDGIKTLTIRRGALNFHKQLKDIRTSVLTILKALYSEAKTLELKRKILIALNEASQTPMSEVYSKDIENMVVEDTNDLIEFYISVVPNAEYDEIKVIDERRSWFVKRFGRERLIRLEELESVIRQNSDYGVFKIFVGYDYRFDEDLNWDEAERERKAKIQEFVDEISDTNFSEWKKKILAIIKNFNDHNWGEFQYFNSFLNSLAKQKPSLALRLLNENEKELAPFIDHLISGLWESSLAQIQPIVKRWITKQKYLENIAFIFSYNKSPLDLKLLWEVFHSAKKIKYKTKKIAAMDSIIRSIFSVGESSRDAIKLFLTIIKEYKKYKYTNWVNHVWYRNNLLLKKLSANEINTVLDNLVDAEGVHYHIEEILQGAAEKYPKKVIQWFGKRIEIQTKVKRENRRYDAVPYDLDKIHTILAQNAEEVISEILPWFNKKHWLYKWDAAHLIKAVFPASNPLLERVLIKLIETNTPQTVKIVFSVLRNYKGEPFVYNIAKALAKQYPDNVSYMRDLYGLLSQTGVVHGEYGFVEAYTQKKQEIQSWKSDMDPAIQKFITGYEEYLDKLIQYEKKQADEEVILMEKGIR